MMAPACWSDFYVRSCRGTGDTGYIWRHGAVMLFVSVAQICFAICAIYFGSQGLLLT